MANHGMETPIYPWNMEYKEYMREFLQKASEPVTRKGAELS